MKKRDLLIFICILKIQKIFFVPFKPLNQIKDIIKNKIIIDCDRSGTYDVTARMNSSCPNAYINIINQLVYCMSNYSCGQACVYTCPYTETVGFCLVLRENFGIFEVKVSCQKIILV